MVDPLVATGPPMVAVVDVEAAAAWWEQRLGFAVTFRHHAEDPEATVNFAAVERDDVEVHLARRDELTDRRRTEITMTVADVRSLVDELFDRGLAPRPHVGGGFEVLDPAGNRIVFVGARP
jgi:catechol 2,3-dioxygenase-like lactoylglutathione lyase family enzyme